jgi:prolyl oligopeptidase
MHRIHLKSVAPRLLFHLTLVLLTGAGVHAQQSVTTAAGDDPYLWLEDVIGERALEWVRRRNAVTTGELVTAPGFAELQQRLLAILDSDEKIPFVDKHGAYYYNFWRDANHERGIWRRTTLEEYRNAAPQWETVLNLDKLAAAENENWVWKGAVVLYPSYDRALLQLSRGGADAVVIREFDLVNKQFVADGYTLAEAKSDVSWLDRDMLYVGTDYGPGSLTDSGYPRSARLWRRGTPLAEAQTVFEGLQSDVAAGVTVVHDHGRRYVLAVRNPTFFTSEVSVLKHDRWLRIDKPADAEVDTFSDQLLLSLKSDWTINDQTYPAGTLLAVNFDDYLSGRRGFSVLYHPGARKSLAEYTATKNYLIVNELDNVNNRLYAHHYRAGSWTRAPLDTPAFGAVSVAAIDADESDDYFLTVSGFLTPTHLRLGTVGKDETETLKSLPAFFKDEGLEVSQHEVLSKDGARVPYFQVSRADLKLNGGNPTLLYGYGGFEITMRATYSAGVGAGWLEHGGVFILANIRGGGEFGPDWHNAARREHRQRAYDDFIAIAEDLIKRGVTAPEHLGIWGRSNGGLLMGVMLTQRPDLFGAVICGSPLLDMKRYNKLLAGASWMDEYGNPDLPEDWAFISRYSPYQNVDPDADYPRILFTTSTRDDRVHPGHARKMAARLLEYGHDMLYYENIEGGHGAAANNQQAAFMDALGYLFLWREL